MELTPIRKRIVCIAGFRQRRHGRTGIARAWRFLRNRHAAPECDVTLHSWCDDWRSFARFILSTGPDDPRELDIRIVAYSWGMGHGAIRLANLLKREGVSIERLVSCDGVYHQAWTFWRAVWSPLLGQPTLLIPANVKRVDFLRQRSTWPSGHLPAAEIPGKTHLVNHGFLQGRTHTDADNASEFLDLAMEACG